MNIFTAIFIQPILNLLVWLYNVIPGHDLGVAIILLTLIVKLILYPLTVRQIRQQRAMQEIQPHIKALQEKHKDNKEDQARELMALYKKEKVNPASSCLPLLIQLPVFIALYRALLLGLHSKSLTLIYPFIANPQVLDPKFFGLVDLSAPSYVLAILAGIVQFVQTKQIMKPASSSAVEVPGEPKKKDDSMTAMMNKQMMYLMPIMTVVIGFKLPGGLTLYWLTMNLLTVLQQWILMRKAPPRMTPQLSGSDQTPTL